MKIVKKTLALLLTLVMAMAMCVTAFADETTHKITAPSDNTHTYKIYQIMTGSFDEEGNITNAKWGSNAASDYTQGEAVDASVLEAISKTEGTDSQKAAALKAYANLEGEAAGSVSNGSSSDVAPGYYLISDVDGSLQDADDAYSLYLVKVVSGDITIQPKTGKPTLEKKVKDVNDSKAGSQTDWQDSADYDIDDTIPYKLTATMGDISNYDHYYVKFTDTMTHLTYTGITSVKVGDTTLTEEQYKAEWNAETKVLTVEIMDVKTYGASTGTAVTVEYNATLDADAVIGSTGNPNEAYLTYSNNPNNTGDGTTAPSDTGDTPKDKNIVFTYQIDANKFDMNNKALAGAGFTLYKKNAAGTYEKVGEEVMAAANGDNFTASWGGVDDGDYKIEETTVPTGYQKGADIEFTISATHDTTSDNPTLTELTGGDKFTGTASTGVVSTNIQNSTVSSLPSTGGIGTTLFYVIGAVLMIGAAVIFVSRRRMSR